MLRSGVRFFRSRTRQAQEFEERVRDERRAASYHKEYPESWYYVGQSKALDAAARKGRPLSVEALGERSVLFRDGGGVAKALDAYCPHLGADLSGGRVCEGELECPFHRWRFEGSGDVASIPYLAKGRKLPTIQAGAKHVVEQDGCLFLWHGKDAPHFDLPSAGTGMVHRGDHDAGVVKMHLQEFAENSVDFQHFAPLHGEMRLPWTSIRIPGLTIQHTADWESDTDKPWMAYFHDKAVLKFFGRELPWTAAKAKISFHGAGSVVHFRFTIPRVGEILMMQTHTPLTPMALRVRFRWFAEKKIPRALVSYVVGNWVSQWREDIDIWENKIFRPRPQLVRDDGPVHALRKWYAQFHP